MSRVIGLVSFVVMFFVASASTQNILSTINGGNTKSDTASDVSNQGRVPRSVQRAVDASNADLQRQFQEVQDNVQMQLGQSKRIFDGSGSSSRRARSKPKSGFTTSAENPPKPKRVTKGEVTSNPYAK